MGWRGRGGRSCALVVHLHAGNGQALELKQAVQQWPGLPGQADIVRLHGQPILLPHQPLNVSARTQRSGGAPGAQGLRPLCPAQSRGQRAVGARPPPEPTDCEHGQQDNAAPGRRGSF